MNRTIRLTSFLFATSLVAACGPSSSSGTCSGMIAGDLIVTEVMADAASADEGKEWFELYNNTDDPLEMDGVVITSSRIGGDKAKSHTMGKVTIAPGQYYTLGNSADDLLPPYIDYGYGSDLGEFYNTGGGEITVKCGSTVVDDASYDGVKSGHTRQLTAASAPDYTLNDDLANWCQGDATEYDDGNFGTPGAENDCQPLVVGQCSDNGTMRPTVPPMVGELVITEFLSNPKTISDDKGEWFEALAKASFDLNGIGLDRAGDNNMAPKVVDDPTCLSVSSGDYVVFAKSTDMTMNGGLPADKVKGTFSFSMVDGTAASPGDIRIMYGADVIDAVTYIGAKEGKALALSPAALDATANDDQSNFCEATDMYDAVSPNFGTPGVVNPACGAQPMAGKCMDTSLGAMRDIVKPTAGQLVITEFLPNPLGSGTDATQEWFEIKNASAAGFDLNGLTLKGNTATGSTITSVDCKAVPAGQFALFAHSTDPLVNGGLPAVDATFTFALGQTSGSTQNLSVLDGANVLDTVAYTPTTVTVGTFVVVDGKSKQVKQASEDTTMNDVPANYCDGQTTYGTAMNYGTPKAENDCP